MVIKKVYKQKDTLVLLVDGVPVGFVRDIQGADATAEVQMEDIPAKELMDIKAAFQPLKPLVFTYKLSKDYYCGGGRRRRRSPGTG